MKNKKITKILNRKGFCKNSQFWNADQSFTSVG